MTKLERVNDTLMQSVTEQKNEKRNPNVFQKNLAGQCERLDSSYFSKKNGGLSGGRMANGIEFEPAGLSRICKIQPGNFPVK